MKSPGTRKKGAPTGTEKQPMAKASGSSNEPRPDVDETKRRQEPGSKGQPERSPKQENL